MNAREKGVKPSRGAGTGVYALREFSFPGLEGLSPNAMETHLGLYAGYVKEANAIAASLSDPATYAELPEVVHARESLARRLSFELSGVRLHELFFEQLNAARESDKPREGAFTRAVAGNAGGFDAWTRDIGALGKTRGPGWVISCWDPQAQILNNVWIDLHHLSVPAGQHLVFVLDLWEHAYWDDFGAQGRPEYIEHVLRQTDWKVVATRLQPRSS